jgi:hypothetical protein
MPERPCLELLSKGNRTNTGGDAVVWNKRGNTGGGATSGRGGTKRGGSARTPIDGHNPRPPALACTRCQGEGQIGNPAAERDAGDTFSGEDLVTCPDCAGRGTLGGR